jgi:hypothetical protein
LVERIEETGVATVVAEVVIKETVSSAAEGLGRKRIVEAMSRRTTKGRAGGGRSGICYIFLSQRS